MGRPDYVRLAQLGQLKPEIQRNYDIAIVENEALSKRVEELKEEIESLKIKLKKYEKNKNSNRP